MSRKLFSGDKMPPIEHLVYLQQKQVLIKKQYSYDTYMHQRNSETKAIA